MYPECLERNRGIVDDYDAGYSDISFNIFDKNLNFEIKFRFI